MKLINISREEQKVLPAIGDSFTCAPGAESPELAPLVAADLLLSFPDVWTRADTNTPAMPDNGAMDADR